MSIDRGIPLNVLLVIGHPRAGSLCSALADAYSEGAEQAGVNIRTLALADLDFDPHVYVDSPENQDLEPDLERAAQCLNWADHLVFVYPTWWGTMPALLKGFLDRLVMPGVAFSFYGPRASDWEGLWAGKSAQIITTMDAPPAIYRWLYRAPGTHAMRNATLGFCGVKPVSVLVFGSVRTSTPDQRQVWLEKARRAGWLLHRGVRPVGVRAAQAAVVWLRALRLQFYPMTWAAYTVGALIASDQLVWAAYVWGYVCMFLAEAATVFCNDYYDFESDRANRNFGPFTGGSRVLVEGVLDRPTLRLGIAAVLIMAVASAVMAVRASPQPLASAILLLPGAVLTLGYTVPPLRLCYRGVGEIDVAFTNGGLVLLLGYLLQGGAISAALPWLLSLPLFFAILPAIVLAGIPDRDADASVAKRTMAVIFGLRGALAIAAGAIVVSALLAAGFDRPGLLNGLYHNISYFVLPHAALCVFLLYRHSQHAASNESERINLLLFATLTYMAWFVAVPFYHAV